MRKNIFVKLLMLVSTSLLLMLTSCNPKDISSSRISASCDQAPPEGGKCIITYQIENPSEGEVIEAETETSWISSNFKYSEGEIEILVTPNDGEERVGYVLLKYKGAKDLRVEVKQGEFDDNAPFFISMQAVNPYGATIRFSANNHTDNYFFLVMEKEDIDEYYEQNGEQALYEADLEWINYLAANNSMTLEEFLPLAKQIYALNGEETSMDYTTLEPDVEYTAYCYGMDLDGTKLTEIVRRDFVTEIVDPIDIDFEFDVTNITTTSAEIKVTPSKDSEYYFWTYILEGEFVKYGEVEVVKIMIENLKRDAESNGLEMTDIMKLGESSSTPTDLWANSDYYIVAWAMNEKGNLISEITAEEVFTTEAEVTFDDCTFDITCPEVKPMDILINVKPSKATTRYYISCISDHRTQGYNPDQMAKRIIDMERDRLEGGDYGDGITWENAPFLYSGEQTKWAQEDLYWTFKPDNLYHIYVFGVDENGNRTTEVAHKEQMSGPAEPSEMTFEISHSNPKWHSATFKVIPSNDEEYYATHLMEATYLETFRLENGELDENELMHEIEHYYDGDLTYYLKQGETEQVYSWASDTEFVMLAFAFAGTNTSRISEYKVKAPPIPFTSDADVEATYELFDGNELYKMDPVRWENSQNNCVMYIQFTPNNKATQWYGGVWAPISNYERGVDHLMHLIMNPTVSFVNETSGTIHPWFDNKWSFSYVAEGLNETYGPWHYEEFTPTLDNLDEPYDFWTSPKENSVVKSISKDDLKKANGIFEQDNKVKTSQTPIIFEQKNLKDLINN